MPVMTNGALILRRDGNSRAIRSYGVIHRIFSLERWQVFGDADFRRVRPSRGVKEFVSHKFSFPQYDGLFPSKVFCRDRCKRFLSRPTS